MFGRAAEIEQIGQALRRPDLVGIVLAGPPGVGKSTLLDAAATEAEAQGFEIIRLRANRATSTIPLLVFSTLLGHLDDGATVERFVAVRHALRDRSQQRPLLLLVDDAHHLDDASAALIAQLARELTIFMIASVRSSVPTPEPIAALWTQGIAHRVDLRSLAREAATDVAEGILGGLLDPALEAEVWRRSAGNPLHLRELILGSLAAGSIALGGEVWSRTGELVTSDALTDLVSHRVGLLSPAEQAALCAVALAEPAGVALIERVAEPSALVALEAAGLVKVRQERRRLTVSIAHPLYGEVVRTMTSQLRVRQMRRDLARAVGEWGQRRLDDVIQGEAAAGLTSAQRLVALGATEAEAYTALVGSLAVTGRPAEARRVADEYIISHGEPDPRSLFFDFRWVALIESGRAVEMEAELDLAWDAAIEADDRHRQARLALAFGHVHVDTGRLSAAMAWFERSAALSRSVGERFGVRWALCGQLLAAGQLGDRAAADATVAGLADVVGHPAELFGSTAGVARRGMPLPGDARRRPSTTSSHWPGDWRTRAVSITPSEPSSMPHEWVTVPRRGRWCHRSRSNSTATCSRAVSISSARCCGDASRLAETSARFEQVGYGGIAVASAAAARDAYAKNGAKRDANNWDCAVKRLSLASGGGPGLMFTAADSASPLTRREREIAHLVANGHTSREVADVCFLSARTVENHLARIYDKLGVRSRSELADALRPLVAEGAA